MASRRNKKKNFSEAEIDMLLTQVQSKKCIIFSSASSGVSCSRKTKAWQEIAVEVNSVSKVSRTMHQVKRKWFDMKMETRKKLKAHNQRMSATEGGQSSAILSPLSTLDERIGGIIGEITLSGLGIASEGGSDKFSFSYFDQSDSEEKPCTSAASAETPRAPSVESSRCPRSSGPRILPNPVVDKQEALQKTVEEISSTLKVISTSLIDISTSLKTLAEVK